MTEVNIGIGRFDNSKVAENVDDRMSLKSVFSINNYEQQEGEQFKDIRGNVFNGDDLIKDVLAKDVDAVYLVKNVKSA